MLVQGRKTLGVFSTLMLSSVLSPPSPRVSLPPVLGHQHFPGWHPAPCPWPAGTLLLLSTQ